MKRFWGKYMVINHLYKNFLITSLILVIGISGQLNCSSRKLIRSKDTPKHLLLSSDIQKALDSHASEIKEFLDKCIDKPNARMGGNVCKKEWLPGYYIKYGIQRVSNAEKLKAVIKKHNLDLLTVAEKYQYHIPGNSDQLSDENYLTVVKEVSGHKGQGKNLSVKQVAQLCQVALHAKHYDLHPANYISQKDGTLMIIDTDSHAMPSAQEIKRREEDWLLHGTRIHDNGGTRMDPDIINDPLIKLELPMYSKHCNYDDEARAYLRKELKKREELRLQLSGRSKTSPLKKALLLGALAAAAYGIYRWLMKN